MLIDRKFSENQVRFFWYDKDTRKENEVPGLIWMGDPERNDKVYECTFVGDIAGAALDKLMEENAQKIATFVICGKQLGAVVVVGKPTGLFQRTQFLEDDGIVDVNGGITLVLDVATKELINTPT